ncbi:MAG: hypothetical protein CL930_05790 [Deltaproteobacteria bacterium]|nr:hypothetical protein [Deltaproteobacteria bacterium]
MNFDAQSFRHLDVNQAQHNRKACFRFKYAIEHGMRRIIILLKRTMKAHFFKKSMVEASHHPKTVRILRNVQTFNQRIYG